MNKVPVISTSYVQDQRHPTKVSDKFKVIQASSVGQAMEKQGLSLVSLSTGRSRKPEYIDFQRTLSRYRGPEIAPGLNLDVVYDSKHMGRGVDTILLGIYRLVCTNGLIVGSSFFQYGIRHNGSTYENLDTGIAAALEMRTKLADTIRKFQSLELSTEQVHEFAKRAASLLVPDKADNVKHALLAIRRPEDESTDLWTVFNRIQENAVLGQNVQYTLPDPKDVTNVRFMTSRAIKANTVKDTTFNQGLFDLASQIAA